MIPFHTDEHGFDPGRIMDWYLAKLHPENRYGMVNNAIIDC